MEEKPRLTALELEEQLLLELQRRPSLRDTQSVRVRPYSGPKGWTWELDRIEPEEGPTQIKFVDLATVVGQLQNNTTSISALLRQPEVKSRDEHLSEAKQRALIRVSMGGFTHAVKGLRADLAKRPLTKGVISSDQALGGVRAAMDATLGRGSEALTNWIEDLE